MDNTFQQYFQGGDKQPSRSEQAEAIRSRLATLPASQLSDGAFAALERMIMQGVSAVSPDDFTVLQKEAEKHFPAEFAPTEDKSNELFKRYGVRI